ncbi:MULTISPECIES: hypothetical protein [Rhodomicrobium]|nr:MULTISPECIES: hypothetical protein [Rhodomicrobium]
MKETNGISRRHRDIEDAARHASQGDIMQAEWIEAAEGLRPAGRVLT